MSQSLEGNFSVVVTEQQTKNLKLYQATIKAKTDHKLTQIENITVEAEKPNKDTAFDLLVPYMLRRTARSEVKQIFEAVLHGLKPKITRVGANKFEFEYSSTDGVFIENYAITFIEI